MNSNVKGSQKQAKRYPTNNNYNNVLQPTILRRENISANNPYFFYPMIFLIIILVISLILVFYNIKIGKTTDKLEKNVIANVLIILFVCLIILVICISLLPAFKEIKKLFEQISSVSYVIFYTLFLILFLSLLPDKIIDTYAYIIVPFTMLLGIFMYYKAFTNNYIANFNINYERIKMVILLFCLLTIYITYYNVNPGGLISKYFGYSFLLTIIIFAFAFLYLIVLMTLPNYSNIKTNKIPTNFLTFFSNFSVYGSILFVLFLIVVTFSISTYSGGFLTKSNKLQVTGVITLVLLISICWCSLLISNLAPELSNKSIDIKYIDLFKRSLLLLFGLIISALIIFWIVYNIQNLSGRFGITNFVLSLLLVTVVLGLIYKTIFVQSPQGNDKKNAFFNVIINILFYIPVAFTHLFDFIMKAFIYNYDNNTNSLLYLSAFTMIILIIYFIEPFFYNKINLQGGKLLVNQPIIIDQIHKFGTYQTLNDTNDLLNNEYDYNYAISFWFYLDAFPPNTNLSYKKYVSLLNYANKPNVLYNATTNTLLITMKQKDLQDTTTDKQIEFVEDDKDNRIVFKKENVLLQKWNNLILNYNGGVLDIFLNGVLVKSNNGVIPYYTLDELTIGEEAGIKGKICNVVYFDKSLTTNNIFYLYNMVKNSNPPTTKDSNIYIVK